MCAHTHHDSEKGSFGLPFSLSALIPFRFFYLLIYHYYERYGICMENNYLIVIDMQKDFVTGSLGSPEAVAVVPAVVQKISSFSGTILFTKDTHGQTTPRPRRDKIFRCPTALRARTAGNSSPSLPLLPYPEKNPLFLKKEASAAPSLLSGCLPPISRTRFLPSP